MNDDLVLAATSWKSNADLIADVARLGYLNGRVLDCTYGMGVFWRNWQPSDLIACDLDPEKSPIGYAVNFCDLPFDNRSFDTVVLDAPYKLNGNPTGWIDDFHRRYGTHIPTSWQDRHQLIVDGLIECARVTRRYVLLKCMDQVCSGQKRWQTYEFTTAAITEGLRLVDRFDMLVTVRPQPPGRRQVHTHGNYSTLLVFEKPRR